ncbi:protein translocase subunit SecD [Nannocystis bainbridge]|uniref:Protein translocase subunit SecD n=1 Tax=Nannocystis bainbridge TaxID=2995303 RepID=A0ABT5E1N5_9BACT|nr:protein translocase subunit SecD [Nannocystis bainbridge]MDC0719786.1 protein translocase subunit SecD [Nannocystis bainbridge]
MRKFLKTKALLLLLLVTTAVMMVVPSIAQILGTDKELPGWLTSTFDNRFKLGLDLQGGLHLEYSVAVDEALENKLDQIAAELEAGFKEKKSVLVDIERIGIDRLDIKFSDPSQVVTAEDDVMGVALTDMERVETQDEGAGIIHLKMSDARIGEHRSHAVAQALETVRRRIDAMGIAEPNIYPKNRQIVIELPGLSDTTTEIKAARHDVQEQLRPLLQQAGANQVIVADSDEDPGAFRITLTDQAARGFLGQVFAGKMIEQTVIDPRLGAGVELEILPDDPGRPAAPDSVEVKLSERSRDNILEGSSDFRRLLKVVERAAVLEMRMVDDELPFGPGQRNYFQALLEGGQVHAGMGISVNKMGNYGSPKGHNVENVWAFYAKDRKTLEDYFNQLPAEWRLPASHLVAYGPDAVVIRGEPTRVWRTFVVKARAEVTGESILAANVSPDPQTGLPGVDLKLDRLGADRFEQMSGDNIGRRMAIMLDDAVMSDPVFNDRIPGGNVRISVGETPGQSVRDTANDLVKVLKSGSLPARLVKEFEIRVGADLGKEAVESGFWAFVVGLGAVVAFMAIYYRLSGLIAVFALVLNVLLILAAMAFFQATLTLPGIAGIVLTLGMAVDANVIVYERIRELVREGYTARAAIEAGYDRAFTTILDSQLTTAIAGVVLWQYGSGPIRGFAITLLIGIATSIFTAVFCTRLFFDFQANRRGFDRVSI